MICWQFMHHAAQISGTHSKLKLESTGGGHDELPTQTMHHC